MKKKVALLLALVMILSALPMNVFGDDSAAPQWILNGASISGGFVERDETHTFDVRLPLNALWPMMTFDHDHNRRDTMRMVMDITQAGFPNLPAGTSIELPHSLVQASALITGTSGRQDLLSSTTSPGAFSVWLTGTSGQGPYANRTGIIEVRFDSAWMRANGFPNVADSRDLTALAGHLEFSINLTSRNNGDWVNSRMTLSGQTGAQQTHLQSFATNWPLVWREEGNVIIDVNGGARGFSSQLHLNPIRVRETRFGVLPSQVTLRLEAPAFYTWSFTPENEVSVTGVQIFGGRSGAEHQLSTHSTGSISGAEIVAIHSARPTGAAARHTIYLTVNLSRNDGLRPLVGGFEFRNLWLIPDGNASATGNVEIEATLGRIVAGTPGVPAQPARPPQQSWVYSTAYILGAEVPVFSNGTEVTVGNVSAGQDAFWPVDTGAEGTLAVITAPTNTNTGNPVWETPPTFIESDPYPANSTNPDAIYVWTLGQMDSNGQQIRVPVGTPGAWRVIETQGVQLRLPSATAVARRTGEIRWSDGTEATPGTPAVETGFVRGIGRGGYGPVTLHVGTRGAAGLSTHVYHEQNMRTGHLGTFRPTNAPAITGNNELEGIRRIPANEHNGGLAHWTGVVTSTLIIQENIAGAFTVGFGSPINFEFLDENGNPHPGIRILGVQARAGNNGLNDARNRDDGTFYGGHRNNWFTFNGWLSALDQRLPVSPNVGRLTDSAATLYITSQTITDVRNAGALEIRFWLSLEAGYEWKYGQDVVVTLSGAGINNLPESERQVVIGRAVDPIQTNVTEANFPSLAVETGTLYNIIGREAIEDVIVDVINPNAFTIGDELWLYVTSDVLARARDLNLSGIPTLVVEGSALRFDTGRLVNPLEGTPAVVFTVTRQPNAGEEPTVTISNLAVEGQVFPGVEYQIVVSGTTIANNDQVVFHALTQRNQAYGTQMRSMNRGVFTSLPYHGTVVTNDGAGRWDGAPGTGGDNNVAPPPSRNEFRLQEGVPFGGVADPLIWHIVGPNRVGMVSLRAFAVLIGASDDQIVWDEAARTAQIHAPNFNGDTVGIRVEIGNTTATVQIAGENQFVDIATAVNFLSGPAGTVEPLMINDRVYLPLRFVAETFGFTVEQQGNVVIFR